MLKRCELCLVPLAVIVMFIGREALADPPVVKRLPTAALIDFDESVLAGLFEAELLTGDRAIWVERTQIKKVLKEQELQAAFSPAGGRDRLSLGKLLKADLLVLVRTVDSLDKKSKLVEAVVCETKQGLRLRVVTVPAEKEAEQSVASLVEAFDAGRRKFGENIREIVAVPPIVSQDLGFQQNYLQSAYARLIEQTLLEYSGVAVVELSEAQSLGRELSLSSNDKQLARGRQPLYVMGTYRNTGRQESAAVSLELRLLRGEEEVSQQKVQSLKPLAATAWLQDAAQTVMKDVKATLPAPLKPEAEARQLAKRAGEFSRVGNWEEALELLEASLLLVPDQNLVHREAVVACSRLWPKHWFYGDVAPEQARLAFAIYLRGLEHLEAFVGITKPLDQMGVDFIYEFESRTNGFMFHPTLKPEIAEIVLESARARSEAYVRMATSRGKKFSELCWFVLAVRGLPKNERILLALRLIEEFPFTGTAVAFNLGYQADSTEFKEFLSALDQSKAANLRELAEHVRKTISLSRARPPSVERPHSTTLAGGSVREITFEPVEFISLAKPSPTDDTRPLPRGCCAAGRGVDVLWTNRALYIMKAAGKLRPIWRPKENDVYFDSVAFDGKYVWAAARRHQRAPLLLVLNPADESVTEFTSEDGMPLEKDVGRNDIIQHLWLTGVEPGRACLAGYMGRTWLAFATFDGTKKGVRVFHEARDAANPEDKSQGQNPQVAFTPSYVVALRTTQPSEKSQRRILIGRFSPSPHVRSIPLVVDVDKEQADPASFEFWAEDPQSGRTDAYLAPVENRLFFAKWNPTLERPGLIQVAPPGMAVETAFDNPPDGVFASQGSELHIVGKQWWIFDTKTKSLRVAADKVPWYANQRFTRKGEPAPVRLEGGPGEFRVDNVYSSDHFGFLVFLIDGASQPKILQAKRATGGAKGE